MGDFRFLYTTDRYDDARRFYGEVLAWPLVHAWDDETGRGSIFRAGGDGCVEVLAGPDGTPPPAGAAIAVEVPDVDGLRRRLVDAGVSIAQPVADQPWGHRTFGVYDPAGVPVTFFAVLPRRPRDLPGADGIDGLD
jgi:predicted enzyme related to lactoylglutathione lyase